MFFQHSLVSTNEVADGYRSSRDNLAQKQKGCLDKLLTHDVLSQIACAGLIGPSHADQKWEGVLAFIDRTAVSMRSQAERGRFAKR